MEHIIKEAEEKKMAALGGMSDECLGQKYLEEICDTVYRAATELLAYAHVKADSLFVVGCSTSEMVGRRIGSFSNPELGKAVFDGIWQAAKERQVNLAAQCCEHLNRALILEEEAAKKYGYEQVNVVPQPKAGGSFASAAYRGMRQPVAVEHIRAAVGMDIGDTLIGMHLKEVAVPVRIQIRQIGSARVNCVRTRPKSIGGKPSWMSFEII